MKKIFILSFFLFFFFGSPASADIIVSDFKTPDVRDDFCGVLIDFRYCKCAFHGDKNLCEQVGQSPSSANEIVYDRFNTEVSKRKNNFASSCTNDGGILSGDRCTYCRGEHFKYKNECVTNADMCGADDPKLIFNIGTEKCECPPAFIVGESGMCEEQDIVEIKFDWQEDKKPPFFANGETIAEATVSVRSIFAKDQPLVPVEIMLTTNSLNGRLTVSESDENIYKIIYTTPDLRDLDPSKKLQNGINLNFSAVNAKGEAVERDVVIPVPLAIETPAKISAFGFQKLEKGLLFAGGKVEVEVNTTVNDENYFPIVGAKIELPKDKIFSTDEDGIVEIDTQNDSPDEDTMNIEISLILNDDVNKNLSQTRSKLSGLSGLGQTASIQEFLNNFVEDFASAESDEERKNMFYGLRRTNYALFFIDKEQEFGKTSAESLATVTKDAIANMVDLLDSVLGITGKITEKINSGGVEIGDRVVEKISKQVDEVYLATLQKLGAAMQAGVSKYAPDSKIYLGGLLSFLEDKYLIADNLKAKTSSKLDLSAGIKEYFVSQVNSSSLDHMEDLGAFIREGAEDEFPTLDNSADLDIAKGRYVEMADKYIKAEEGEYWRSMTKSWFDLGFDTIGKGLSIAFPVYSTLISQVENMYKVARSGFVDAANMFQWYKTHETIMVQLDHGFNSALGEEYSTQALNYSNSTTLTLIPLAFAAESNAIVAEYMDSVADARLYKALAEMGVALKDNFPDEADEFDQEIERLNKVSSEALERSLKLEDDARPFIPKEEYQFWGMSEKADGISFSGIIKYGLSVLLLGIILFFGSLKFKNNK